MATHIRPHSAAPGHEEIGDTNEPFTAEAVIRAVNSPRRTTHVLRRTADGCLGVTSDDDTVTRVPPGCEHMASLPPIYPEWLGGHPFRQAHRARFAYLSGEMANGIATTAMVRAMASVGMIGMFGAGGLPPQYVERAVTELSDRLGTDGLWGVNLIHSPAEPALENAVADLLVERRVPRISASAYMGLTPAVVHCAAAGLRTDPSGRVVRRTRLFVKISHPSVAEQFMTPAPARILRDLVACGRLTESEARLAALVPVAEDITVEADSGGHTDNRPLTALLPRILDVHDGIVRRFGYARDIRIGAAGGLGTPQAVASAFAMGAAYVVTGTVNQLAVEAGISEHAKDALAEADITDVTMAPAADMFELGVRLQVLSSGTMFAPRASRLYTVYRDHASLDEVPRTVRERLERDVLGMPISEVWARTRAFWQQRDPAQLARAEADPKHRMALVFRWYLGLSSHWAIDGDGGRRADYQIWCGPAIGAFNQWRAGSFMADRANCTVTQIALNLMEGAAHVTRAQQLRASGVPVPAACFSPPPRPLK
ncbi:PfaD family polyunsaturated fatty acid/polyketide biosynthesis protein [Streptomyces alfalfae]|uniref:PfaD family polyunsaturated fatty acid/polyketide biosynthesis protein n=1 Tax=Streptomyces alfalfae TaxID=1642299 RepID=A0A7T4PLH4_9ACTN|nr:PfaD family polyunsaturated fatty acid/polyketide biosynthesis protein [Streptomyces alfalfae]QQC92397.1 PfaD family polyunsaturated fatty acid/polyketide biosynthesis protein [Streptomyces alfalfae]